MILIDTNVFSELMHRNANQAVLDWVGAQNPTGLFISTILLAEIFSGIGLKPDGKRKDELRELSKDVAHLFAEILPFNALAAPVYGEVIAQRARIGRPIEKFDGMIAAIALVNDLDLATRNVKDFEGISGLRVINPWEKA